MNIVPYLPFCDLYELKNTEHRRIPPKKKKTVNGKIRTKEQSII